MNPFTMKKTKTKRRKQSKNNIKIIKVIFLVYLFDIFHLSFFLSPFFLLCVFYDSLWNEILFFAPAKQTVNLCAIFLGMSSVLKIPKKSMTGISQPHTTDGYWSHSVQTQIWIKCSDWKPFSSSDVAITFVNDEVDKQKQTYTCTDKACLKLSLLLQVMISFKKLEKVTHLVRYRI